MKTVGLVGIVSVVGLAVGCSSAQTHTAATSTMPAAANAAPTSVSSAPAVGAAPAPGGVSRAASGNAVASPTKPSKSYSLTLIQGIKGDPFYVTMACGASAEAKRLGAHLAVAAGATWDASVQTPIVTAVTAKHPDAVMIAPNDTKAMIAPLRQMTQTGIKLVLVDTGIDDHSFAESVISSDNLAGGRLAADTLGPLIGGKGSVFVMNVAPGISTTDARAKGFLDEMKAKYPGVTVLPTTYNNDDAAKAASVMTSVLAAHPDLAGMFATNILGAEGAATGLKQARKQGSVKVIGFDAGPQQVQDLKAGTVQGLIAQDPYTIGVDGVDAAIASLSGQPVTKSIQTNLVALTNGNLAANAKYEYKGSC